MFVRGRTSCESGFWRIVEENAEHAETPSDGADGGMRTNVPVAPSYHPSPASEDRKSHDF